MINLLLPEDKKIILKEYRWRVVVLSGLAVGLLLAVAIVSVLAFYFALLIDQKTLKETLEMENKGIKGEELNFYSEQIKQGNKMINLLTGDQNSLHLASNLLDRIIGVKPVGIKINTIEIGQVTEGRWIINLRGIARQRNDLTDFISILKKDSLFDSIDSPLANLIKGENSDFTIVITLASIKKNDRK